MKQVCVSVLNEVGLHARPAALFVQEAGRFISSIRLRNLSGGTDWVDAKSILSVLALGVERGHQIEVQAQGEDEDQAVAALTELVNSGFGEKP
jgi:phosphocarrier protein HPr